MFLNFGVDFPVYFGTVADISGIVGKNGVDCVRVALMGFDDCFILIYFFYRSHPPHKIQFVLHIVIAVF